MNMYQEKIYENQGNFIIKKFIYVLYTLYHTRIKCQKKLNDIEYFIIAVLINVPTEIYRNANKLKAIESCV